HLHHLLHTLTEEKEAAHREANALRQTIQEQSGLSDQIESAVEEKEAVQCEVADLRQIIADQAEQLEALTGNVKILSSREKELRSLLLDAHDQLIRRDDELQTFVYQFQNSVPGLQQNATSNASSESSVAKNYISYQQLINRIREVVDANLPPDVTIIVVSKG